MTPVDLSSVTRTSDLPSDATYFDLYDGETLVAHTSRPGIYAKSKAWQLTLYRHDRSIISRGSSYAPLATARAHMRGLRAVAPGKLLEA